MGVGWIFEGEVDGKWIGKMKGNVNGQGKANGMGNGERGWGGAGEGLHAPSHKTETSYHSISRK